MSKDGHDFFLFDEARNLFFRIGRSNRLSSISGGAMPTIQSVRRNDRQTSRSVTVEAFLPPSRFRRAVREMPLRAANVSNDKLAANRAARTLDPKVASISFRV